MDTFVRWVATRMRRAAGSVLNIAGYKFVRLQQGRVDELREVVKSVCVSHNLMGTVYLAREGFNACLSGQEDSVRACVAALKTIDELAEGLHFKESWSETQPFDRLLVRRKKEVIAMGLEVGSALETEGDEYSDDAPKRMQLQQEEHYLAPKEFEKWLDEGRDITILDTRNDYEWRLGSIRNSILLDMHTFRHFPTAIQQLFQGEVLEQAKSKPLVMYCTGGIRCEKAAPYLRDKLGLKEVYQLHGGILKYFEDTGGKHYKGECYIFDKRLAVKPDLSPSDSLDQCETCRSPLTEEDKASTMFSPDDKSCPYCMYRTYPRLLA